MKTAFLFPGQGSQSIGMLADLAASFPIVEQTFAEASEVFGDDLWALSQQGPAEKLNQTAITQPALLAANIAVFRVLQTMTDLQPTVMAGHSLGEYAALVASGHLDFTAGVALVAQRGQFMQEATPAGIGSMAAIIGLKNEQVDAVCQSISGEWRVESANLNCPGQVVIAGHTKAVDTAIETFKADGAKAIKLPVSVPSHCFLMKPAAEKLAEALKSIDFKNGQVPVIHNTTAGTATEKNIATNLEQQLYKPVRWSETIDGMLQTGVELFLELGPGKVLTGLQLKINRRSKVVPINDKSNLDKALEVIES